ncbi:uncharacterized protein LOC111325533 [Stylophora pistillata]|uniref:uncharacterized protein LOC111325533 n=1 Tax=Stylophora pistillata TaxID=50429 RepID=UPI000C0532DF|nr:uncharacterized protein LOC111325533 [Stylophora pistillata]
MDLTDEGHRYKLIKVQAEDLEDLNSEEKFTESDRYILDCRNIKPTDILSKLTEFYRQIKRSKVSHVWINSSEGEFLEIKERLVKLLAENGELSPSGNHAILKLTKQDHTVRDTDALKIGIDVLNFGKSLLNVYRLMDAHPGILYGKVHMHNSLKRKRSVEIVPSESAVGLATRSYADQRRPGKKVFKALKKMIGNPNNMVSNRKCYMCNETSVFDRLCGDCHFLNEEMKKSSCDLKGRYAIVTGGRIKIGFETALRLLRDECFVVVTTRFPANAVERFSRETDFKVWKHRLKIARLDLQDMQSVDNFLNYVQQNIPHLDILVNNAAQTIFRPFHYYQSLISEEVKQWPDLAKDENNIVVNEEDALEQFHSMISTPERYQALPWKTSSNDFPSEERDEHGEQLDIRQRNSWTYNLDEVPLQELLQVLTINTVGPFILTAKLKPLLKQSPFQRKFVVNVSAMEGQFSRINKGHRHPHTNMAKAALNMMTRTSGLEFQMDGIYMTAVDTGWVTDERPFHQAQHEAEVKGFVPPLDCQDGAARVYHPIVHGLNNKNSPYFAVFLKDFKPKNW